MTRYFLIYSHGNSGGGWLMYVVNNHPTPMSMFGELQKASQLDFAGRGIPMSRLAQETNKLLQQRADAGDAACGIFKAFRHATTEFVQARGGIVTQIVKNPLHIVGKRDGRKPKAAVWMFNELYGREPSNEREVFEGHVAYYAATFFDKFLARAEQYPIIRLDDLNASCGSDGTYFKRVMECLTRTEWPIEYVRHIQEHNRPHQWYRHSITLENNVAIAVNSGLRGVRDSGRYNHWGEDPGYKYYWDAWPDWKRMTYLKYFASVDRQLGYNQHHPGSTEVAWDWKGKYEWG